MATCPECFAHYEDEVESCAKDGARLLPDEACQRFDEELRRGDVVGEYRIEKKIGEGAYGKVYSALHPVIGKHAAIKVLNRKFSSDPQVVSRFVSEARAVNQIRHRHIIDIFSFGTLEDGLQYFVMELLEGSTLNKYLKQHGRLSPEEAIPILRGIGRALDAAHAASVAHRDLKPENVFVSFDEDGRCYPKLLDFGIAKLMGDEGEHHTRTGALMGSPGYMSPEQCRGKNVDHRTDIYAMGVMCHELLTGKRPFTGESTMDLMFKHAKEPPPPMSTLCPAIPASLDEPVLRMLAKEPADRPDTLAAAIDALALAAHHAGFDVPLTTKVGSTGGASGRQRAAPGSDFPAGQIGAATNAALETDVAGASKQRRRGSTWVMVAVGLLVCGGAIGFVMTRSADSPDSAPASSVSAAAASPVSAGPKATADSSGAISSASAFMELSFEANVDGIEVRRDGVKLGTTAAKIRLPRSEQRITLTLVKPGYETKTIHVKPIEDVLIEVELSKLAKPANPQTPAARPSSKPATPPGTAGPSVPKDLETPF